MGLLRGHTVHPCPPARLYMRKRHCAAPWLHLCGLKGGILAAAAVPNQCLYEALPRRGPQVL